LIPQLIKLEQPLTRRLESAAFENYQRFDRKCAVECARSSLLHKTEREEERETGRELNNRARGLLLLTVFFYHSPSFLSVSLCPSSSFILCCVLLAVIIMAVGHRGRRAVWSLGSTYYFAYVLTLSPSLFPPISLSLYCSSLDLAADAPWPLLVRFTNSSQDTGGI